MKPFDIPTWRRVQIREKFKRKDKVVQKFSRALESVMFDAIDYIMDHAGKTGQWHEPSLNAMYVVSENFYRDVIEEAFHSAKYEKEDQQGRKRLARLPTGLPKNLHDLGQIFNDRKYWQKIMKRSKILTDRLKRQYLQKLKDQFKVLMPRISSGEFSPQDAKMVMKQVWHASKPRVETIFRTETTKYFAETQINYFSDDSDIIGFLFDSVRDSSRTEICRSRHGLVYKPGTKELTKNSPPCHYNCRSHLIALANTEYNRKLVSEQGRNPNSAKVVPLPRGWK